MVLHLCFPRVGFIMAGPQDVATRSHWMRMFVFLVVWCCYLIPGSMMIDNSIAFSRALPHVMYGFPPHDVATDGRENSTALDQTSVAQPQTSSDGRVNSTALDQTSVPQPPTSSATATGRLLSTQDGSESTAPSTRASSVQEAMSKDESLSKEGGPVENWMCFWSGPPVKQHSLACTGGSWSQSYCCVIFRDVAEKEVAQSRCQATLKFSIKYDRSRKAAITLMTLLSILAVLYLATFRYILYAYETPTVEKLRKVLFADFFMTMSLFVIAISTIVLQNSMESTIYLNLGQRFVRNLLSISLFGSAILCSCYLSICDDRLRRCICQELRIFRRDHATFPIDSPDAGALAAQAVLAQEHLNHQMEGARGSVDLRIQNMTETSSVPASPERPVEFNGDEFRGQCGMRLSAIPDFADDKSSGAAGSSVEMVQMPTVAESDSQSSMVQMQTVPDSDSQCSVASHSSSDDGGSA